MVINPFDRGFMQSMRGNKRNLHTVQVQWPIIGELYSGSLALAGVTDLDIFTDKGRLQLTVSSSRVDSPDRLGRDGLPARIPGTDPGDEHRNNRQHEGSHSHNRRYSHIDQVCC
jgi:hypothetical protein